MNKMTANGIKLVLMYYWRYVRQMLCADEVSYNWYKADLIILRKNGLAHEIEVKCSKSDLCNSELNKNKHKCTFKTFPNYFSFAVTEELLEDAKKVIEKLNPKYGLIVIPNGSFNTRFHPILHIKRAKLLHDTNNKDKWIKKISYRLNSALIQHRLKQYKNHE